MLLILTKGGLISITSYRSFFGVIVTALLLTLLQHNDILPTSPVNDTKKSSPYDPTYTQGEENNWTCDRTINFILDVEYSPISLTNLCGENNVCDANPIYAEDGKINDIEEAVSYCKDYCLDLVGCKGFFFQKHMNGHEICGFYMNVDMDSGTPVWHGHQEGSRVCTLHFPLDGM